MLNRNNTLDTIEFLTYPNLRLHCSNGVKFDASLNAHNREKFDEMDKRGIFPELLIEDYNAHHGILVGDGIQVIVYLERQGF